MRKDVIIALDFPTGEETLSFLGLFAGLERKPFVKIGMELFYALEALKRPEITMDELSESIPEINIYPKGTRLQLELKVKYEGYISRQDRQVDRFTKLEGIRIPEDFDYDKVDGISSESREKLKVVRPTSIGQASRISGVRTSDITVLLVYLRK